MPGCALTLHIRLARGAKPRTTTSAPCRQVLLLRSCIAEQKRAYLTQVTRYKW